MDYKYTLSVSCAIILFAGLLFLPMPSQCTPTLQSNEYLRMHIRANSNSSIDQNIKYEVRDNIVDALTPLLVNVHTKTHAMQVLNSNIDTIVQTANYTLKAAGLPYTASASIHSELFPTRSYDDVTLISGVYDSLIIELGSGTGDNWWCVVYPPLCFVGTDNGTSNIIYRSKLLEIINNFYGG